MLNVLNVECVSANTTLAAALKEFFNKKNGGSSHQELICVCFVLTEQCLASNDEIDSISIDWCCSYLWC